MSKSVSGAMSHEHHNHTQLATLDMATTAAEAMNGTNLRAYDWESAPGSDQNCAQKNEEGT